MGPITLFLLQLAEIQPFSRDFLFVSIFLFSPTQSRHLLTWNIHIIYLLFFFQVLSLTFSIFFSLVILRAVNNLCLSFLISILSPRYNGPTNYLMLVSSLLSFLGTCSLSMSSHGCQAFGVVINFLVGWSVCLRSSLVHFRNGPEYYTRRTAQI